MNRKSWGSVLFLTAGLGVLVGCSGHAGTAYIVHRPDWDYASYERVAVLPGRSEADGGADHAARLADRLTSLLADNGQFTVLSRGELADVFREQDLSRVADAIDEGTALPEGQIEVAQVLVSVCLTDYTLIQEKRRKQRPKIRFDRRGRPVSIGEETVTEFVHGAEVEGTLRVVDAASGRILLSHTERIAPRPHTRDKRPPDESPEELAEIAVRELGLEFYHKIAPTRVEVEFNEDSLIVATGYFDGRYHEEDRLPPGLDEVLLAVVDLPSECDRNAFRVAIAPEEVPRNIFESEAFVWSRGLGAEGERFSVPIDVLHDAAVPTFVAKLYSVGNPEPVIERPFELSKDGK